MSSFFPFSSSSSSLASLANLPASDDPHLEVTVTPSASAFYAGETFSVTITFRNTRPPLTSTGHISASTPATDPPTPLSRTRHHGNEDVTPRRLGQIGPVVDEVASDNAVAGPSRPPVPIDVSAANTPRPSDPSYPYSPGADPSSRAPGWPVSTSPIREGLGHLRSPEEWRRNGSGGHSRKSRSLALGQGAMTPQEMVWALGGQSAPPPLPARRQGSSSIPSHHPHSRKISIASTAALTSPPPIPTPLPTAELAPIPETTSAPDTIPSRSSSRVTSNSSSIGDTSASASASRSHIDLTDDDSYTPDRRRRASPSSPVPTSRMPSYHNAYGAAYLGVGGGSSTTPPPPTHPYVRSKLPTEPRGTTTILWAYTRLVAQFHPSNAYIPPDPLLPLRAMLLHQPVGSGSLVTPTEGVAPSAASHGSAVPRTSPSRWQLSFGTGTIGNTTQPSFTGSLFGLAKDLVYGGSGGSLEEERKRVWNMKDLPVLETARSLLGVDVRLAEGESRQFVYTIQLPASLPPAHRGRAFRFSYDLVVSLTVALPGPGKRQKSKEIEVPIRVWANVSLGHPIRTYDILKPVIQISDEGETHEQLRDETRDGRSRRRSSVDTRLKGGDTQSSLESYAKHLVDTLDGPHSSAANGKAAARASPMSPSRITAPKLRIGSPTSPSPPGSPSRRMSPTRERMLEVPNGKPKGFRVRQGSFVQGDDELLEAAQEEEGCGEAVEVLSRHSAKASYDIAKDGEIVAVLTLIKTTYRLGETVLGVVTFNSPMSERRVLKLSAYLESHELIPENLLPLSASTSGRSRQPPLGRLHAEHHSAYTIHTSRLAFSLDIPSDATPAFSLAAGPDGFKGGLEWRVRLAFLVSVPTKKRHRKSQSGGAGASGILGGASAKTAQGGLKGSGPVVHLVPREGQGPGNQHGHGHGHGHGQGKADGDNRYFAASEALAPLTPLEGGKDEKGSGPGPRRSDGGETGWEEMRTETMECEVPVKVLAGNTAFLVRPSVHIV